MGRYKQLQLKLLSNSGEVINCVNCFAGQVTVFRASLQSSLRPYQAALAGTTSAEKFLVNLDAEPFRPSKHNLIGFGEQFVPGDPTVTEMLVTAGVPPSSINSLLLSYGLEHVATVSPHLLPPCEERRLRILTATYSSDRVLVLNDPFEPISNKWRERFAELIVSYARMSQQIVVVPLLNFRPEAWIDNQSVARVQVGEALQKTIGFGTESSEMNELLKHVRKMLKEDHPAIEKETEKNKSNLNVKDEVTISTDDQGNAKNNQSLSLSQKIDIDLKTRIKNFFTTPIPFTPKNVVGITILILATIGGVSIIVPKENDKNQSTIVASVQPTPLPTSHPAIEQPKIVVKPEQLPEAVNTFSSSESMKAIYALALYPAHIRASILETFSGNTAAVQQIKLDSNTTSESSTLSKHERTRTANELLELLQSANDTGKDTPATPENREPENEEERRELIRQKFLEAIRKAAEQRNEQG